MLLTRALRSFGYGYLAVVLAIYLERLGLDAVQIGVILSGAIAGSAVMTILWSIFADSYGRRRTVATMAFLMAAGGLIFALTDNFWLLLLGTVTGTISATSGEVGSFLTVEQAVLPQTAPDTRRTWLFSIYNMLGNLAGAVGSLFAGAVGLFASMGLAGPDVFRPFFVIYAAIGAVNLLLFLSLSDRVELVRIEGSRRFIGIHRSWGMVIKLSALFGLDAFAGGFVIHSFVAYWFHVRWGMSTDALAVVFFWVGVLSGLSLLAAGWLALRIGLLNTMVFTHLPSNILLMLIPFAPAGWLAVALFLVRMSISQMDVPTRQSYTMAVVAPDERTATAGITNVARTAAQAISPVFATLAVGASFFALPFFLGGGLKVLYDLLIYFSFRDVHPPEEEARLRSGPARKG